MVTKVPSFRSPDKSPSDMLDIATHLQYKRYLRFVVAGSRSCAPLNVLPHHRSLSKIPSYTMFPMPHLQGMHLYCIFCCLYDFLRMSHHHIVARVNHKFGSCTEYQIHRSLNKTPSYSMFPMPHLWGKHLNCIFCCL